MEIDIGSEQVTAGVAVHVRVRLSPRELNQVFLSGDTLIQLPTDGIVDDADGAPMPRTSIFLSEVAGTPEGFSRVFSDAARAERFAEVVGDQISAALEEA